MFWILILSLFGFSIIAAYRGINLVNWTLGMALLLVGFAIFTDVSTVWGLSIRESVIGIFGG